jgi:DNA-binding XRE family transcriptional regulator
MRKKITFDHKEIELLAANGLTLDEMAAALGVSRDTLLERRKDTPEFDAAIRKGKAGLKSEIANILTERARKGDMTAVIWLEKTRFGYRENMPPEPAPHIDKDTAVALLLERVRRITKARREGTLPSPIEPAPENGTPVHPALYRDSEAPPLNSAAFIAEKIEDACEIYNVLKARAERVNEEIQKMKADPTYKPQLRAAFTSELEYLKNTMASMRIQINEHGVETL